MKIGESILYYLSKNRVEKQVEKILGKDQRKRGVDYAQWQFNKYLKRGVKFNIKDKVILEIGCGHGGISCFLAVNGAKDVFGLDINEYNLQTAKSFKQILNSKLGNAEIPVSFINENVHNLSFDDNYFDIIIADNVFEHFDDNVRVMLECKRVLKEKGKIIIPSFPSIYSKNGAHLKKGIGVGWVYLFFKERTIVNVLKRHSESFPILHEVYGGLKNNPDNIRDVRKYKDLNYITNKKFKRQVLESGLQIGKLEIQYTNGVARLLSKLVINKFSIIHDILSLKTKATLIKS